MNSNTIFYPVLAHIFLVFWLYLLLAVRKKKALQAGKVDPARRALFEDAWPDDVIVVNNSLRNQFQVPVLFYAVCFVLWGTDSVNLGVLALAWLFVVSRLFHAQVHTGSNIVSLRFRAFVFGFLVLLVLAIYAAITLIQVTI